MMILIKIYWKKSKQMLWMFLKSFCAGTMPIFNGNEALNAMIMPGFPIMQETMKLNDDIGTNRKFRSQHGKHFLMPVLLCHYYSLSISLKIYKKCQPNPMKVEKNME